MQKTQPQFKLRLGNIVATRAALTALGNTGESPNHFLRRHHTGDWGELCDEDRKLNDAAVGTD